MPTDCGLKYPETFPLPCITAIIDIALKQEAKTKLRELVLHATNIVLYLTGIMLPENADDDITPIGTTPADEDQIAACEVCLESLEQIVELPDVVGAKPVAALPIIPLIALAIQLLRLYLKNRR